MIARFFSQGDENAATWVGDERHVGSVDILCVNPQSHRCEPPREVAAWQSS